MVQRISDSYKAEHPRLLNFIRSKVRRLEDAEDIAQDVFYQAFASLNALEPIEDLVAWLYRVARNRIIDWYRKKKPVSLTLEDERGIMDIVNDSGLLEDDVITHDQVYEAVLDAIEELPLEQRTVLIMQSLEGLTFREIAAIENISINTLIARKRYAIAFLRKRLKSIQEIINNNK